jgi:hypothetical protein
MPHSQLNHSSVRLILLADWDPLGVAGILPAENEYDPYVEEILHLAKHANQNALAQHLHDIETKRMGRAGDMERCVATAQRLHALRPPGRAKPRS